MGKKENEIFKHVNKYKIFYVLSAFMILYFGFSLFDSYQNFVAYCNNYGIDISKQWVLGLKSILASSVPCLVYAATLYGLGLLLKDKE